MKQLMVLTGFILLLLLGGIGQVQASTKIDTTPYWDGSHFISSFGKPDTSTYGQVITAPSNGDSVLQSFSFNMNQLKTTVFRGYVYAWDGAKATGPALYESSPTTTAGSGVYDKIEFKTLGIQLTPGAKYVLFASVSKDTSPNDAGRWGSTTNSAYGGGNFVFINNGTNTAQWTTTNWSSIAEDLAFTANFVKPAQKILYWKTGALGTDSMKEALIRTAQTYSTSTTIATDLTDFENKIAAGGWDLVILMNITLSPATPKFNAYVSGGGKAILADWTKDAVRGALFGATYSGHDNQDPFTISNDLLNSGVDNPLPLTNPGYAKYSLGMAATTGKVAATFPNGDAAIVVAANGNTIINGFAPEAPTSTNDGAVLFENEITSLFTQIKVTSPNGGERIPTGGVYNISWIPSDAVSFDVDISTKNGSSWKPLVKQYGDSEFEWRVPLQKDNMPSCKIRVTGYDEYGVKIGQDVSDNVFTIEVVRLLSPIGGETFASGSTQPIEWATNDTMGTVASVQLFYALDGKKWKPIATVNGNPGSYTWTVPTVTAATAKCKVKAVLKSLAAGKGKVLGTAISDAPFTVNP